MEDLVIMTRPPAWKYAHVLLPGSGELRPRRCFFAIQQPNSRRTNCSAVHCFAGSRIKFTTALRIALSAAGGFITWCCTRLGRKHAGIF